MTSESSRVSSWGDAAWRPALTFVLLTYGLSWGIWGGGYLLLPSDAPFVPVVFLGVFGPAVAGALTVHLAGGDVRGWLRSTLTWRVSPKWYLAAVLVPVLAYGISAALLVLADAPVRSEKFGLGVAVFLGGLPTATLLSGGNEELGWRGFLLPRIQQRYDAVTASLVVGVVWAGWHLPVYLLPLGLTNGPYYLFVPFVVLFSFVCTWVYNGTCGSVPVAMVLHGSMNSAVGIFAMVLATDAVSDTFLWATRPLGLFFVVVVLVVVSRSETLGAERIRRTTGSAGPLGDGGADE